MPSPIFLNLERAVSLVAAVSDFIKLYESLSESNEDGNIVNAYISEFCRHLEGNESMEEKVEFLKGLIDRMFSRQVELVTDRSSIIDRAALALASQNRDGIRLVSSQDERTM